MKKLVSIFLVVFFVFLSSGNLYAEDGENDDTNNLNLDTEILNNKKETYNSRATIGDINLFTEDYKEQLRTESSVDRQTSKKINSSLFSNQQETTSNVENENNYLFYNKIEFKKMEFNDKQTQDYTSILVVIFAIISIFSFVLTRRSFNKRKGLME